MNLLDDYSGPVLTLRRECLCEAVGSIVARCFVVSLFVMPGGVLNTNHQKEGWILKWILIIWKLDYYLETFINKTSCQLFRWIFKTWSFPRGTFTQNGWPCNAAGCFVWGSSFWILLSDLTYSYSIVFILENKIWFLPYIRLKKAPSVLKIFFQLA